MNGRKESSIIAGGINEVIAVTFDREGRANAAPIGIINRSGRCRLVLFKGTHTLENVLENGVFCANIVYDPVLYVKTAFEDIGGDGFTEECFTGESFTENFVEGEEKDSVLRFYRLKSAESCVLFKAVKTGESAESCIFELDFVSEKIIAPSVHPFNRGYAAVIDAAVHGTRYVISRSAELKSIIDYDISIAKKCGGERENEAVRMLLEYIK